VGADGNQSHGNGNHLLVEPGALPALREAFADALAKVDRQIELAGSDLRITAWANDPVSTDAATAFNERSVDAGESALGTLHGFRRQLSTAVDNLDRTAEQYRASDEDSSSTVSKQEEGAGA
jgi:hypothetical protein